LIGLCSLWDSSCSSRFGRKSIGERAGTRIIGNRLTRGLLSKKNIIFIDRDCERNRPFTTVVSVSHHCGLGPLHHYNGTMAGRKCYHCKQWVEEVEGHDCWTTTETALTQDLSGDLQDAWERLRETAVSFGDQRIYASHKSVMFSRKSCYFFVRPKRNFLEVCLFLGRTLQAPQVRRVDRASKYKIVHVIQIRHRDEVEVPITDWLREAYELSDMLASNADTIRRANSTPKPRPIQKKTKATRKGVAARDSKRR
jgi:Domain of unknown function (DUF5655)